MSRFEKVSGATDLERERMGEQFGSFALEFQKYFFPQGDLSFLVQGRAYNNEAYREMHSRFLGQVSQVRRGLESGQIATLEDAIDRIVQVYANLFAEYNITPLSEGRLSLDEGEDFLIQYQLKLKISQALEALPDDSARRFLALFGGETKDGEPVAVARADLGAIQAGAEQEQTAETLRFGEFCEQFQEYFFPEGFIPPSFVFEDDSQRSESFTRFISGFAFARAEVEAQVRSGQLTADQAIEGLVMRKFYILLTECNIWISIGGELDTGVQNQLRQGRQWLFEQVRDAVLRQQGLSIADKEDPQVGNTIYGVRTYISTNLIED